MWYCYQQTAIILFHFILRRMRSQSINFEDENFVDSKINNKKTLRK